MEEDIKILESYLEQQDRKFVSEYRLKFLQAIENLINRNKELEVAIDDFMKGKAYSTKQLENININYIPKFKLQELLEE